MLFFFQLYLAHLVADVLLRPGGAARPGAGRPFAVQVALHAGCAVAAVNLGLTGRAAIAIAVVALAHPLLDRWAGEGWLLFLARQAAHLVLVALGAIWVGAAWAEVADVARATVTNPLLYLYACAYVGVVFGGGVLVQTITQSFLQAMHRDLTSLKPGLPNAGKYIGWVERVLILTFIVGGYEQAVGFLLAAKALVRYPEIKEDTRGHFAEYFLVGTLTSVGLALAAGLAVNHLKDVIR